MTNGARKGTPEQRRALDVVKKFEAKGGSGVWSQITKKEVVDSLKIRIMNPTKINQAGNPSCGPTTFVYGLALRKPEAYATFVIDLFTRGKANINKLSIVANEFLRKASIIGRADPADWIAFASLRNSENYIFPMWLKYINNMAGMTDPGKVADWMRKSGYKEVKNRSYLVVNPIIIVKSAWASEASRLFAQGHQVMFLIDGDLMSSEDQDDYFSLFPTHWVGLRSKISDGGIAALDSNISFKVYSWGRIYNIPVRASKALEKRDFLNKFYGFVSGRL